MSSESRPSREVAYRVFAAEYDDATYSYKESDEERAPNYVVTPSGARVNRLFVVGVLTELERVGDDDVLRARVVDPTGAFVVYAGQYQPEPLAVLEDTDPPSFVAVTGKANTFTPDGSDRTFSSIRPESVTEVDADTRDRWVVTTAEHTIDRIAIMADALNRDERGEALQEVLAAQGLPPHLASGIPRALDAYGTRTAYLGALRELSLNAARQVAGQIDEVPRFDVDPDDQSGTDVPLDAAAGPLTGVAKAGAGAEEGTGASATVGASETPRTGADSQTELDADVEDAPEAESGGAVEEPSPGEGADARPTQTQEEATEADASDTASVGEEPSTEEELYQMDEEEREAVESEYGVEFTSGTEIPDAGESEIDTPDGETEATDESPAEASDSDSPGAEETSSAEGDDLEDVVIERMQDMGDGEGVERTALIEDVSATEDVDEDTVAEAIQSALMSGRCYESGQDELTPI